MKKSIFFFLILASIKCFGLQNPINIVDEQQNINIKNYALVFNSEEVIKHPNKEIHYLKSKTSNPFFYFDFTKNTIWVKFKIKNRTKLKKELLLNFSNAMINEIIVYKKYENTFKEDYKTGIIYPFISRIENHRNFVIPIEIEADKEYTYVISFHKKEGRPLITEITLSNRKILLNNSLKEYIIIGIYVGLSVIFLLISLYLYVLFKDRMYLYYSLYILFLGLYILSYTGVFQQYFLNSNTVFNKYYHYAIFSEITLVFFIIFSQRFLNAKKHFKKLNKIIIVLLFLIVFIRVLIHFFFKGSLENYIPLFMKIWYTLQIAGMLILTYQITVLLKRKLIKNYLFAIAYLIMIFGTAIMLIYHSSGLVNGSFFNLPILLYSSLIEIILISLALALTIKQVLLEKQELVKKVAIEKEKSLLESITLNNKQKIYLKELIYLKSDGNYIEFYTTSKKILDRNKMKILEETLPANFVRIHKSFIINRNYIKNTSSNSIELVNNIIIPLSRYYKKNL